MKISHGTRIKNINDTNGYGYATVKIIESLRTLGYHVEQNDASADVEIWFDQPQHWKFQPGKYKIGLHPWESTSLKQGWVDIMNQCDEIWTPSPVIARWYKEDGIKVPIFVYEHGVDREWYPMPRRVEDKIRFLHVGVEAARKGGVHTMKAFRNAFPERNDVELTMKTVNSGWKIDRIGKVNIVNRTIPLQQLVAMYHEHHIFVYPSWGEGFGLTPLQAMATGMPTITVPAWAPYKRFLDDRLNLKSQLRRSPWHYTIHPGKMFRPDFDGLVDIMRWAVDNYDAVHEFAQAQTDAIFNEYDWIKLTRQTFEALEKRLESS